jgi:hypothetical protein
MSRRVLLHVGTPKSGTSYLQDKLALNRDELTRQGLDYVRTRTEDHFEAALDLLDERWAGEEKAARGQWDALVAEARGSRHDAVVVSHEILAGAAPASIDRALASFPGDEVHVIVTARDLGRQIPAEWQERVKHRSTRDYTDFLKAIHRNYERTDWVMPFWRVQHLPRVLAAWGSGLPADRVHLVTVPPSGAPRHLLWDRFAGVLGLDLRAAYDESPTTNASLGGAEVTLLRRLNEVLADREVPREVYVSWVRESLVKEVLAGRTDSEQASVPPGRRPTVEAITADWLEQIRAAGYDVVGDLADLEPVWPDHSSHWPNPDHADAAVVADAAIEALAHVVDRAGRLGTNPVARIARRLLG